MQINIGFEVEVILDDLGKFHIEEIGEPMDIASLEYLEEVAAILSAGTGRKWIASEGKEDRDMNECYVIPEYDLDPLFFLEGQIAGVELITPPLPINEASVLREKITHTISPYAEEMFHENSNSKCGWHINIDFDGKIPDPVSWVLMVDEYELLAGTKREGKPESGSSIRPVLIDAISAGLNGTELDITHDYLTDVMKRLASKPKCYAANFSRGGYLEMRHLGSMDFLSEVGLQDILAPVLDAEWGSSESIEKSLNELQARMNIIAKEAILLSSSVAVSDTCSRPYYSPNARDILIDGEVAGLTFKEITKIGLGHIPSEYSDKDILILHGDDEFLGLEINVWEAGSTEERIIMLAYEMSIYGLHEGIFAPVPKSEGLLDMGRKITTRMIDEGVPPTPAFETVIEVDPRSSYDQ